MSENTGVPEIQKAVVILHKMSADEEMREIARLREKAIHDERSAMNYARREGVEIGEKKKTEEFIAKMRSKGYTEEQIQEILN